MFQAAMLFWLPVALMPLGFWISNASRFPNIGKLLTITGLSLVLLSPWTVPRLHQVLWGTCWVLSLVRPY